MVRMEAHKSRILKDFSAWLREAKEDHGGTQVEFAKALGVKQEQVSRWINGHFAPTLSTMRDIAKRLKRPLPPSLIGHEEGPNLFESRSRRFVSLRREARQIAAGEPLDDPEDSDSTASYAFSIDWFRSRFGVEPSENSKRFHAFRLAKDERGESMEPTIPRGSVVLMDREGAQEEGAIYVVRHPDLDGLMCKRVYRTRDGLVFESDNRAHRPIVARLGQDKDWDGSNRYVLGRVVWVGFEL